MKEFKIQLEAYTSNIIVWTILLCAAGLMIANISTMFMIYNVIETMWAEIAQVKETNISLYQFIEAHRDDFD